MEDEKKPFQVPSWPGSLPESECDKVNIQIMAGVQGVAVGNVILVIRNAPIQPAEMPNGETTLVPCVQLSAQAAIEIAANMIYVAKIAQQHELQSKS